jgi:hypothetical protein
MAANTSPIYSAYGDIQGGDLLTTGAADYTGQGVSNFIVFTADTTNGGYIQRLRFKAIGPGNNIATVARVYFNDGDGRLAASIATPGTPAGTLLATGGTLQTGTATPALQYFGKLVAIDQYGSLTAAGAEGTVAANATTSALGSINWTWTAVVGAVSYRLYVGPSAGGQVTYFNVTGSSYTQTTAVGIRDNLSPSINNNNMLIGELSLPATTGITTAATVDIDYPLNFALPPGGRIIVGLGATVATGWIVTGIGGKY